MSNELYEREITNTMQEEFAPLGYERVEQGFERAAEQVYSGEITRLMSIGAHPDDQLFWAGTMRYLC